MHDRFRNYYGRLGDAQLGDLIEMQPGDVVFFHGLTIHGSMPNRTTDRFRRAFICHYVGETSWPIVGPPLPKADAK